MKTIRWLIRLADGKPVIFSLAMLLIAVLSLSVVVRERNSKVNNCEADREILKQKYDIKFDSLAAAYRNREVQLENEVKQTLNLLIVNYKEQLKEQKEINKKVDNTLINNRKLINRNTKKISQNDY